MLKNYYKALLIAPVLLTALVAAPLKAQETQPLNRTFDRALNNSSGNFFDQVTISGQANMIFGWRTWPMGSYPENQITQDAQTVEILTRDVIKQQVNSPGVRTRDLPSPYSTSVKENPSYIRPAGSF